VTTSADAAARVLLVDSLGYEDLGGAATVINEIIKRVDRTRFLPTLAALGEGRWPEIVRAGGTDAYSFPRSRLRSPANLAKVVLELTGLVRRQRIDLIHASENSALLYGALAGRLTKRPVVWHIHAPLWPHWRAERIAWRLLRSLPPAHIVFTSPGTQRKTIPLDGVPTSVVLPGIDVEQCRSGDAARGRKAFEIPDHAQVISMFGRIVSQKGQADFFECLGRLHLRRGDLYGIVCGPGDRTSAYWHKLEAIRDRYGLHDRLFVPGDVRPPLKDDIVAASDVVVHPARSEPFGLAVLEAMAAGKPVVAARTDGPGMLIEDGVDGVLVDPEDVDGLTAAVDRLLGDARARADIGQRAHDKASRYPVEGMVRRIEDVWHSVLAGPSD
jgi:glycosyltransferase involved in cell wall biosynthesis